MLNKEKNFAYIDGANLHKGVKDLGWSLDYRRFRIWLKEKYTVERAYLFIGLMPKRKDLYTFLQEAGFTLVFKEITYDSAGNVKGNCDADLVLAATRDAYENNCDKAILVSCDGDYASLVKFLMARSKFKVILSPNNKNKLSILLKRTAASIAYLDNKKSIISQKEKAPDADGTA
ncbi:MAG TPA: NYN domain-containing protein [Candidatus Saccharimonadales bacterium]|nr:NYN domain-containing protein [Candidatus Saccharimonadales bacterium]